MSLVSLRLAALSSPPPLFGSEPRPPLGERDPTNCLFKELRALPAALGGLVADYILPNFKLGSPESFNGDAMRKLMLTVDNEHNFSVKSPPNRSNVAFKSEDLKERMYQIAFISFACHQNFTAYNPRLSFLANFTFTYECNFKKEQQSMITCPLALKEQALDIGSAMTLCGITKESEVGQHTFSPKVDFDTARIVRRRRPCA